jgi:hypothetical protein
VALPTSTDLKTYLRIETNAENALLAALVARAQAMVEGWIDCPITAESQTAVDRAESLDEPVTSLIFPRRPIASVSITDSEGATVDPTTYTVYGASGMVYAKPLTSFYNGPYTITASCGLSLRSDYARMEPLLTEMILDLAADLYQRRTPGAASEKAGDTTISWDASRETVARVVKSLRLFRLGVAQ